MTYSGLGALPLVEILHEARGRARVMRACGWAACIAFAVAAPGCTSSTDSTPSPTDAFAQLVDSYLNDPASARYSAAQVDALEHAKLEGELSFEPYSAAIDLSLECISDAGYHVERHPTDASEGYPRVAYFYESPEEGNPVADECIRSNSEAIEAIYQLQPSAVEAKNAYVVTQASEIETCLEKQGTEVDFGGLTGGDLAKAIYKAVDGEIAAAIAAGTNPQMDCFLALSW